MGTRNVTMVIDAQGVKKVAQYGQWDGYPDSLGIDLLDFLRDKNKVEALKSKLPYVRFVDFEKRDKLFINAYNVAVQDGWADDRTPQQKFWHENFTSRNLSAKVLTNIAEYANQIGEEILLEDDETTGYSDGWCAYCYVINFQKGTFAAYKFLNKNPLKTYPIDNLPSNEQFVQEVEQAEKERYN